MGGCHFVALGKLFGMARQKRKRRIRKTRISNELLDLVAKILSEGSRLLEKLAQ